MIKPYLSQDFIYLFIYYFRNSSILAKIYFFFYIYIYLVNYV